MKYVSNANHSSAHACLRIPSQTRLRRLLLPALAFLNTKVSKHRQRCGRHWLVFSGQFFADIILNDNIVTPLKNNNYLVFFLKARLLAILDRPGLSFIETDVKILRKYFDVDILYRTNYARIRSLIKDAIRRLSYNRPDIVYFWFIVPWDTAPIVFFSRLIGTKSVLVTGGYDIANIPEINFGLMRESSARRWTRFALRWSNLVLPFSEFSKTEVLRLIRIEHIQVLYPGVNIEVFQPSRRVKQNLAITVGTVGHRIRNKGLDIFAACSKLVPEVDFVIIGRVEDIEVGQYLKSLGGDNLHLTDGRVSLGELVSWYQTARIYVQVSWYEGFGLAIAEAMACGCIPVVTKAGSIPEVVGSFGYFATVNDPTSTTKAIRAALMSTKQEEVRNRVVENFTIERREDELRVALERLLS